MSVKKKTRRKKTKTDYWDNSILDQAILDFAKADEEERAHIYTKYLHKPLTVMVESIPRKYAASMNYGIDDMDEIEAQLFNQLYNKIEGFNPTAETKTGEPPKSFSYAQAIIKYYLMNLSKNNDKKKQRESDFDIVPEDVFHSSRFTYSLDDPDSEGDFSEGLFTQVVEMIRVKTEEIDETQPIHIKYVGTALVDLLGNWEHHFKEETPEDQDGLSNMTRKKFPKRSSNPYKRAKIMELIKQFVEINYKKRLENKKVNEGIRYFKEYFPMLKEEYVENY